jgi:Na+-transporting NADH:ubiquinone oxidoreductase subunit D
MAGRAGQVFLAGLGRDNPVFVQVLGICSTLAVTNVLKNTLVMCLGLVFALALTCPTLSAMRRWIPPRVRMMAEVLVMACYVIVVDIALKAALPDVSRQLGPYVGLIITNCILMGRVEAFSLANPPFLALVDGVAAGLGYSYVLLLIAFVRELFGTGGVWGVRLLPAGWVNWSVMVMAPGAFFVLALFVWVVKGRLLRPAATAGGAPR